MRDTVGYLVNNHTKLLKMLISRFRSADLANEAISNAFIKLTESKQVDVDNIEAYVTFSVYNEARRLANVDKKYYDVKADVIEVYEIPDTSCSPEEAAHNKAFNTNVLSVLTNAKFKAHKVLRMYAFEDKSYPEIALELDKNLETTRSLVKVSNRNGLFEDIYRYLQ